MRSMYVICPVRNANPDITRAIREYVWKFRGWGWKVHFPPDDVDQNDPTGEGICDAHLAAMLDADEVHVFWDEASKGSHFDLGMAYALGKVIVGVQQLSEPSEGKSYWNALLA